MQFGLLEKIGSFIGRLLVGLYLLALAVLGGMGLLYDPIFWNGFLGLAVFLVFFGFLWIGGVAGNSLSRFFPKPIEVKVAAAVSLFTGYLVTSAYIAFLRTSGEIAPTNLVPVEGWIGAFFVSFAAFLFSPFSDGEQ